MGGEAWRTGRVMAVAHNTFREAIRNRAFVGLVLFAVAFILLSLLLSELTVVGQGPRVVQSFGFFAVSSFGAVTAIVMGALLVYKELERKTIYTILSKPVHRYEFIAGKYAGLVGILMVQILLLGVVWFGVIALQGGTVSLDHVRGLILMGFEVALVAAVAVMFSSITTPVLTGLFSLGVFGVGRLVTLIEEMLAGQKGLLVDHDLARFIGESVVAVWPDLSVFNISQQVLLGVPVSWSYVGSCLLYGASYSLIFFLIGVWAFERRDFV